MQYLTADSNVRAGPAAHRTDILSYNPAPYAQRRNNVQGVLHGEGNTGKASLRTTTERMCQPQEADVQGVHPSIRERKHKHLRLGDTPTRGRACQPWKESSEDGKRRR